MYGGNDGLEDTRFEGDNLYDIVLKLNIFRAKDFIGTFTYAFSLYQNGKEPTVEICNEYINMLYKLMPLAKKMVAMGEDFE